MDHGLCHQQSPFHPARQGPGICISLVFQTHRFQQFHCPPLRLWYAIKASLQFKRFLWRKEWVEHDLLRYDPDRCLCVARMGVDIKTPDCRAARALHDQSSQYVDKRRFPGTIWSQQPEDRTLGNVKADIVQRLFSSRIFFRQVVDRDSLFGHAPAIANAWYLCNHMDAAMPNDLVKITNAVLTMFGSLWLRPLV